MKKCFLEWFNYILVASAMTCIGSLNQSFIFPMYVYLYVCINYKTTEIKNHKHT